MHITSPIDGQFDLQSENTILLRADRGEIFRVSTLDHDIFRVQHLPFGNPSLKRTWMILGYQPESTQDLPFEGRFRDDYSVFSCPAVRVINQENNLRIETKSVHLKIRPSNFQLTWLTINNQAFAADREISPYPYDQTNHSVYHYMCRYPQEYYYGFGERSGPLNKKGRRMRMFNMDALGYNAETSDPLYKHFPVYITYNPVLKIAYGLIYDNLSTTTFDMGCEIDNYHAPYRFYQAEHGDIDYYFIYGPSIPEVVRKISILTGKMALPPKWSLGYLGSSMAYTDAPDAQDQLQNFCKHCDDHDIPCDLFHLSSGYSMDDLGKRYVFIWNNNRVPNPQKMIGDFHKSGIKVAANIKPALLTTHPDYHTLVDRQAFIRNEKTDQPELSLFWGGTAAHLDFTNPNTIQWWKEKIKRNLLSFGIDGTWNDNNEFPIMNDFATCVGFGDSIPIGLIRPIQPMLMTRASREAQLEYQPQQRPYLLCRSGCPGIQRYAQTWSGDNHTSWNSLKYNIPMGLSLSMCGAPNTGHDVGGFAGPKPDPELFVRWVQNGIFHPRFTIHSWNEDGSVNEPWMYPDVLTIIRDLINFRYQLIPYFYSLFYEAAKNGTPIIRPLVYHFPQDPHCWEESFDFMLGDSILVASVLEPGVKTRTVYLPNGEDWYDFWHGIWYSGGKTITVDTPLETIPLFIRGGGILPMGKPMHYIGEQKDDLRKILLFPHLEKGTGKFTLYEDDGVSFGYQNQEFTQLEFVLESNKDFVDFQIQTLWNNFELPYQELIVILPRDENRPVNINTHWTELIENGQRIIKIKL